MNCHLELNEENFKTVVQNGNTELVTYWKKMSNFKVSDMDAVKSENSEMLDLIDDFSDYNGEFGHDPLLENIAIHKNINFLKKFEYSLSRGIYAEFVRFNFMDGIKFINRNVKENLNLDFVIDGLLEAINSEKWDYVNLALKYISRNDIEKLYNDILNNFYAVNFDRKTLDSVFKKYF